MGEQAKAKSKSAAVSHPVQQCLEIGPFRSVKETLRASDWLAHAGIAYGMRTRMVKVPESFWVYLPPLPSHLAAVRMLRELDRKGIHSHIIVSQPGFDNAISLGLYNFPRNAHVRLAQLAEKGVHAREQVRYRSETRYWLDANLNRPGVLSKLQHKDWKLPGVRVHKLRCAVAPTQVPHRTR